MATPQEWQARNALQQQLRASGDAQAIAQADRLQQDYRLAEKAGLCTDVYASARGELGALNGWARASEHPERLLALAPELNLSPGELKDLLQPTKSGFRAEIYLPDPAVLGPDAKPQLVFKGSSGQVVDPAAPTGLRDTTAEDFGGNNFPQSIGLKTDYYDRAMGLASQLSLNGLKFEIDGHSLGGGMASAASAVSGMPAVTFNAAGLNPITPQRFAQENRGIALYDTGQLVKAYQVRGELLNDGVQDNLAQLDRSKQAALAGTLREVADVIRQVPEARELVKRAVGQDLPDGQRMPPQAQASLYAFIDTLATAPDVDALLKDLPSAAGQRQPLLPAKTYALDAQGRPRLGDDGRPQIVDRPGELSLREATAFAGPMLEVARAAAAGAHLGHRFAGPAIGTVARADAAALDLAGDGIQAGTTLFSDAIGASAAVAGAAATVHVRAGSQVAAGARQAAAQVEAATDRLAGQMRGQALSAGGQALHLAGDAAQALGRWVPGLSGQAEQLERRAAALDRAGTQAVQSGAGRAEQALQAGQQDAAALRAAGTRVSGAVVAAAADLADGPAGVIQTTGTFTVQGLDQAEALARGLARHDRAAGAALGAAVAGAADVASQYASVPGAVTATASAVVLKQHGAAAGAEALARHLMPASVLPSIDAQVREHEADARQLLQNLARKPRSRDVPAGEFSAQASEALQRPASPLSLADPGHAGHALYRTALSGAREGLPALAADAQARVAGALAVEMASDRLLRNVEGVVPSRSTPTEPEGARLTAFGRAPNDPGLFLRAEVNVQAAQQIPLEQSSQQVAQVLDERMREQEQVQQRVQARSGPVMS